MPLVSDTSESNTQNKNLSQKRSFIPPLLRLPRNVYILLIFTTGKGFQIAIAHLTSIIMLIALGISLNSLVFSVQCLPLEHSSVPYLSASLQIGLGASQF